MNTFYFDIEFRNGGVVTEKYRAESFGKALAMATADFKGCDSHVKASVNYKKFNSMLTAEVLDLFDSYPLFYKEIQQFRKDGMLGLAIEFIECAKEVIEFNFSISDSELVEQVNEWVSEMFEY